jgi:hypothetical protein
MVRRWALLWRWPRRSPARRTSAGAQANRPGPPHEWVFGTWTGGIFPVSEVDPAACFGSPDRHLHPRPGDARAALDTAYHQRAIETAATLPDGGLEFRFVPAAPMARAMGGRLPPDIGFGCGGSPDLLRVQRRGPDEIAFPDCTDFPSPLKRCVAR